MKLNPPASSSDLEVARQIARRLHQQRRREDQPGAGWAEDPAPRARLTPPPLPPRMSPEPPPPPASPRSEGRPAPSPAAPMRPEPARHAEPPASRPQEPRYEPRYEPPAEPSFEPEPASEPAFEAPRFGRPSWSEPVPELEPSPEPEPLEDLAPPPSPSPSPKPFEVEVDDEPMPPPPEPYPEPELPGYGAAEPPLSPEEMVGEADGSPLDALTDPGDSPFGDALLDAPPVTEEPGPPSWDEIVESCLGLAQAGGAMLADPAGKVFAATGNWPAPGPDAIAGKLVAMMAKTLKDAPTRSISAPLMGMHLTAWRVPRNDGLVTAAFIGAAPVKAEARPAIDAEILKGPAA